VKSPKGEYPRDLHHSPWSFLAEGCSARSLLKDLGLRVEVKPAA